MKREFRVLPLFVLSLLFMSGCPPGEWPGESDVDGDGFALEDDCNDDDDTIHPEADESCDGIDNDCDGEVDEDTAVDATLWYADGDGDGAGDEDQQQTSCTQPAGYVDVSGDCDDEDANYHPGASEEDCTDPNDYNCDGSVQYVDADGDGFPACEDCDDADDGVSPAALELCNGVDDDCDGTSDEGAAEALSWYRDADGDGFGDSANVIEACAEPDGYVADATDCDDQDNDVFPEADELCNGEDDDCDSLIDEADAIDAATWYVDGDGDGHGNLSQSERACLAPSGQVDSSDDCDDGNALVSPSADEQCNGIDDDCDGTTDEGDSINEQVWFADADGDGYGNPLSTAVSCDAQSGYVADASDCDDQVFAIHPGATEYCDSVDNDCDGSIDESDAVDALLGYLDFDGDSYGGQTITVVSCTLPSSYVLDNSDCDDSNAAANPGAAEVCSDAVDNDCDSLINEPDAIDVSTWYVDADGDGYGDAALSEQSCSQPSGQVALSGDCDESDPAIHPGAAEVAGNGVDDNCVNDLPLVQSVTLPPGAAVFTDSLLSPVVVTDDPEGEPVSLSYRWFVDGSPVTETGSTLDGQTYFDRGQVIFVEVTPSDPIESGVPVNSSSLTVSNSPPSAPTVSALSVGSSTGQAATEGQNDLLCSIDTQATDADGDGLVYSYEWLNGSGTSQQITTQVSALTDIYPGSSTTVGTWTCQVSASDGTDSGPIASVVVTVAPLCTPGSQTFAVAGLHAFAVPSGCTSITLKAWGAGGGCGVTACDGSSGGGPGGGGGYATAVFALVPGSALDVLVGGTGGSPTPVHGTPVLGVGGFGGGGDSGNNGAGSGGGGGMSGLKNSGSSAYLIIAGAGGGAAQHSGGGGVGGGTSGGAGGSSVLGGAAGAGGGTQSASANGVCGGTSNGSQFQGGKGCTPGVSPRHAGGGGGGGYFGGGGGGPHNTSGAGAGGGGSSFVSPTGSTIQIIAGSGSNPGNAAEAGGAGRGATVTTISGTDGKVILAWAP